MVHTQHVCTRKMESRSTPCTATCFCHLIEGCRVTIPYFILSTHCSQTAGGHQSWLEHQRRPLPPQAPSCGSSSLAQRCTDHTRAPGDCPGVFSAGLDLTEMCGRNPAHYAEYWKAVQELWLRLYLSNLVLIAAISGACPAGGCLISLTCDYRVLADNPKCLIGLNETLLGIIAPFWFRDTLVNTIGHRAAERALQLGLLFPPAEALQVGMVDQVVPEDQVQSTALSVMAQWMAIPDHARQLTKNMMRKPTVDRLLKQRDADIQNFVSFISRDSIQKSLQMYLEKLKQKKG
uniref:Enoyl-CoA delta isomerase 1, mitochondrial n=1 Tax=Equus caballus TaxID=9796 RepID=A0A9L0SD03_HORSE